MRHKVCSAIRKLQTIPVPGVSQEEFVRYMKAETRLSLPRVRRMVMLALKSGVEHNVLTVDKKGLYRLNLLPVPKKKIKTKRNAKKRRNILAGRGRRGPSGRARAVAKPRQGQGRRILRSLGKKRPRACAPRNRPVRKRNLQATTRGVKGRTMRLRRAKPTGRK